MGEGIMLQIQPSQIQPVNFRCRFGMMAADAPLSHDFCVFDFPGCKGCPKAQHTVRTVRSSEDPMNSEALRAWLRALPAPKSSFSLQSARSAMEKYIHLQNLILFKKRLAETDEIKPLDRKVLGSRHRLTAPSETPGERQFIASLVTAMRLGLINQRSSYAFIDQVGKMR
jgi:hypothetical protein